MAHPKPIPIETQRAILKMKLEGLTVPQIAKRLNKPFPTVARWIEKMYIPYTMSNEDILHKLETLDRS